MSMYTQEPNPIPEETARVARAAYPHGTLAMRLRDTLGGIYCDEQFAALFSSRGRPAEAPWRLAMVLVLQYVEGLTDRQAADAVRGRIDWKYALALPLEDPGFDASVLSEFRTRLVEAGAEQLLLDALLALCKERGWLKAGGKQRTDATHVLAAARSLSNLECVGETLRAALNEIATVAPDWLVQQITSEWLERYEHRVENYRLPKEKSKRTVLAEQIGADGAHLLRALAQAEAPAALSELASIRVLRQVWEQYYELSKGRAKWRDDPVSGEKGGVIRSPYDPEARTGKKRERIWLGYKVHLTETCDVSSQTPHLVTAVATTPACITDVEMTALIQEDLAQRNLLPDEQVVDSGYVDGELLSLSQQTYGLVLLGPALADNSWQAKAGKGFESTHFQIDWQAHCAICPCGQTSSRWTSLTEPERIEVVFARTTCAACSCRADCTRSQTTGRVLHLRPRAAYEALLARRQEQETSAFRQRYAVRAGIEGTLSQGVRVMGLRHARYVGLPKTHFQHILTAAALNVVRIDALLTQTTRGQTRHSALAGLASHPALKRPAA
jgi:transposase